MSATPAAPETTGPAPAERLTVGPSSRTGHGGSSPPRVLHVVRSLETGGLERLVCDLVRCRGTGATAVACLTALGPLGEALRRDGAAVHVVGMTGGPVSALGRLYRCIRAERPAVLHCHNLLAHLYASLASLPLSRVGRVVTKHGAYLPPGRLSTRLNRRLMRGTRVVAVSDEIRALMAGWLPYNDVITIANGLNLDQYARLPGRLEARRQLGWPEAAPLVGTVARLSPEKDFEGLVKAFATVRRDAPTARLVIVGEGPHRPAVAACIDGLGLADCVTLLGERHDIPRILAALDVFVLSSWSEGVPITILEAMAAGLPVVSSAVGGIPTVVADGSSGLLVPAGAHAQLAEALGALVRDPERRERLGAAGRRLAGERFDIRQVASRYEELYLAAAASRRRSSLDAPHCSGADARCDD